MLERPRFRQHYRVERVDPDLVFLLSESDRIALRGRTYHLLAPHLDGSATLDEIVSSLASEADETELYYATLRLQNAGHLEEAGEASRSAAFWSVLGAKAIRSNETIGVRALGGADPEPMRAALRDLRGALDVVVTEDPLDPVLATINRDASRPWLLVKPTGTTIWVGPLFIPGRTACWACLADRLQWRATLSAFVSRHHGRSLPHAAPALPSSVALACEMAATEIARFLALGANSHVENGILGFDIPRLELKRHAVVRRPTCEACGEPAAAPQPPILSASRVRRDGPVAFFETYQHHVSPVSGVVDDVQPLERVAQDELMPVWTARFASGRHGDNLLMLRAGLGGVASGRGSTAAEARATALGEALERHCGTWHGDEPCTRTTLQKLGDDGIHPNRCMLWSDAQVAAGKPWYLVPTPFDETREMAWTQVWSLTGQAWRWLPSAYLYYGYPIDENNASCFADSNGCAAGVTREDAIASGLLELIERDAIALWWFNRTSAPGVDLRILDDPYAQRLLAWYQSIGREVWALDITSDCEIPSYVVISRALEGPQDIIMGFAAAPDPRHALLSGLTEMNQSLVSVRDYRRDGGDLDASLIRWWDTATVDNQPYLKPHGIVPLRATVEQSDDTAENVRALQQTLEGLGREVLVLDQTRPDIGLPVVRTLVPGLRPPWARFAPGRLYDVPVKLGRLTTPRAESEMNPFDMFF